MKTKLKILAVALIVGGTMFAQPRVSIGIGIGGYGPGYYPPSGYAQYVPPCPGPDYAWVDGYWGPQGGRNVWTSGYWRRPYASGYQVGPRYVEPRYYNSYRGNDRDRGYSDRYQNRGGERYEGRDRGGQRHEDRGRAYSNSYRR